MISTLWILLHHVTPLQADKLVYIAEQQRIILQLLSLSLLHPVANLIHGSMEIMRSWRSSSSCICSWPFDNLEGTWSAALCPSYSRWGQRQRTFHWTLFTRMSLFLLSTSRLIWYAPSFEVIHMLFRSIVLTIAFVLRCGHCKDLQICLQPEMLGF